MTLSVRRALKSDIPILCTLLKDLFSIEDDFSVDEKKQRQGLECLMNSSGARVLVACLDDRVVGMVTVQALISTAEGGPVGLVEDLVVHHDFRGKGVGRALINRLVEVSQTMKMTRLQLLADKSNRAALDFYASTNWSATQLIALRKNPG